MLYLRTFGGLSVETDGAPATGAARQRKTLAVLALLAAAGRRGMSRDKLLAYLWPDSDVHHGRNRLKQACFALRRDLGAPELFLGTLELRLNPLVISSDVQSFEDALDRGDPAQAVALYRGPFLDGFYVSDAGEFERWVEEERAQWLKRVCEALESLAARAEMSGEGRAAVGWWRRFVELDRFSTQAVLGLMRALLLAGDRTAALEAGQAHQALLHQVLGTAPAGAVTALLERTRDAGAAADAPSRAASTVLPVHRPPSPPARVGPGRALAAVAIVTIGVLIAGPRSGRRLDPGLLVVGPFEIVGQTLAPWRADLMRLMARNLDGALQLRAVPSPVGPERGENVFDARAAVALGRRTEAGLVLVGALASTGPDSVRLSAAVLDVGTGATRAEFTRMDAANRIDRLADSLSLDVLRALAPSTSWVSARLRAPGTHSLPALKAFLRGETYLRRYWLDSAAASYERATALDPGFALAWHGLGVARSWNLQASVEPVFARAAALSRGLNRRDSLLLANDAPPPGLSYAQSIRWKEEVLIPAVVENPEDPEVWHQVGETQFHLGYAWPDSTWNRARRSFNGAIARDSGSAKAYLHPVELVLNDNDPAAALRYVRGYLAIPSVNPEGAGMHLLALRLDRQAAPEGAFERELNGASLTTLRRLAVAIRWWPDPEETQILVARRLLAKAQASFSDQPADPSAYSLRFYRSLLARTLIFRGRLAEARRLVGNRLAMAPFLELARLGVIASDTVEAVLRRGVPSADIGEHVVFPFLMEAPCFRTMDAALWRAARRDTAGLLSLLRSEQAAERTRDSRELGPYDHPVPAFARTALALARGDTAAALERFRPDSACPGAQQPRDIQFQLLAAVHRDSEAAWVWERLYDHRVPLLLERARVAERMRDRPTAIHYYQFVLQAWRHADPELQPAVAEARAALARLGGEPR